MVYRLHCEVNAISIEILFTMKKIRLIKCGALHTETSVYNSINSMTILKRDKLSHSVI